MFSGGYFTKELYYSFVSDIHSMMILSPKWLRDSEYAHNNFLTICLVGIHFRIQFI